uniref:L-dopachrome isomerase n=1 Tax=Candidatus Kentrum sp. LFY TaxID=2126342 RepID=A0A450UBX7_9GAMM|nr:MAG: Phenylpyruvate tautomerase PptA, 4-oxalocrotonate tautomerase family [Candidatus Kentron sp. LFY]
MVVHVPRRQNAQDKISEDFPIWVGISPLPSVEMKLLIYWQHLPETRPTGASHSLDSRFRGIEKMPYLRIQSNISVDSADKKSLLTKASASVASQLGKPERYMMTYLDTDCAMTFGGSDEPLAFVELKGLDLSESRTAELSDTISRLLLVELGIRPDRVYIIFSDIPRAMWGWNGGTF